MTIELIAPIVAQLLANKNIHDINREDVDSAVRVALLILTQSQAVVRGLADAQS